MKKIFLLCSSILLFLFIINNALGYGFDAVKFSNGNTVTIDIASSPSELKNGLMYRDELPEGVGMLFIFETEDRHSFWMKNMAFPIDIIWVDSNLRIVDITSNVVHCENEPCSEYTPSIPVRYVLEVADGYAKRHNIVIGEKIVLTQNDK